MREDTQIAIGDREQGWRPWGRGLDGAFTVPITGPQTQPNLFQCCLMFIYGNGPPKRPRQSLTM